MIRLLVASAAALAFLSVTAAPPTAENEVMKAIEEGNDAGRRLDRAAYARFLADELQWISGGSGVVLTKEQRLSRLNPADTPAPRLSDSNVRLYGEVAVVTQLATYSDGAQWRMARTLVKREGRWQLLMHAQVKLAN